MITQRNHCMVNDYNTFYIPDKFLKISQITPPCLDMFNNASKNGNNVNNEISLYNQMEQSSPRWQGTI